MKPLRKKVLIKPDEFEETRSESGIIAPMDAAEKMKQTKGVVVAVPDGIDDIKAGDHVIYSPLTFDEIKHEGEDLHVVEIDDVFAILNE